MKYQVTINNKTYEVEVERGEANLLATYEAVAPVAPAPVAAAPVAAAPTPATASHVQAVAGEALTAPMPGTIINVMKKVGDKVAEGEVVCILEAMKMENEVVAAIAGTVGQVLVAKGSVVKTGDPLVMIH
ncbi:MAG: acetyl-CoA carboxylase biotin carboxyl carrier protein subunit [Clostridia bacterium]|nr:acetyl-CoA carboxylase biotin carboxyl carrier protein subunit [Clostridia bacterium]NCC76038.1 acetyl-CoA carboxylase biotin carboxyl carrier protein subunit [Clostridia bacterium]